MALSLALGALSSACGAAPPRAQAPPLALMEEPLPLIDEPADEAARVELPYGSFSGVYVVDGRRTLDALLSEPEGVLVERVVENSPGEAAGLEPGDLLYEVERAGVRSELRWPSDWRALELAGSAGEECRVLLDRAGRDREARLVLSERLRPAEREPAVRLREEDRTGVVLRAASEVEARAVGLAPGAGAVLVGLSRDSPWRAAGLVFGDLLLAVDGHAVAHPEMVVDAIRTAESGARLTLQVARGDERFEVSVALSRRAGETSHVRIPLLFSYEREREASTTSALLGLLRVRRTRAAWDVRLLWLISFGGGDSDRLVEVGG